jgi:hypothetical protein
MYTYAWNIPVTSERILLKRRRLRAWGSTAAETRNFRRDNKKLEKSLSPGVYIIVKTLIYTYIYIYYCTQDETFVTNSI